MKTPPPEAINESEGYKPFENNPYADGDMNGWGEDPEEAKAYGSFSKAPN